MAEKEKKEKEVATWRKFHVIVIGSILLSIPLSILIIVIPAEVFVSMTLNFVNSNEYKAFRLYWETYALIIFGILLGISLIEGFIKYKKMDKEE